MCCRLNLVAHNTRWNQKVSTATVPPRTEHRRPSELHLEAQQDPTASRQGFQARTGSQRTRIHNSRWGTGRVRSDTGRNIPRTGKGDGSLTETY